MTDLRFLDPTGLVNRAAFNERFEQLNLAAFVGTDGLEDINGNDVGVRIAIGTYTGTGTVGSSHPNTLAIPFLAKALLIRQKNQTYNNSSQTGTSAYQYSNIVWFTSNVTDQQCFGRCRVYYKGSAQSKYNNEDFDMATEFTEDSVSWYAKTMTNSGNTDYTYRPVAESQLNANGTVYQYLAIG